MRHEFAEAHATDALDHHNRSALALLDTRDLAHRTDAVEVVEVGLVRIGLALQDREQEAVGLDGVFQRREGTAAPHLDGDEQLRKDQRIAQR